MKTFQYFCEGGRSDDLPVADVGEEVFALIHVTRLWCNPSEKELSFGELEQLVSFCDAELVRSAQHTANFFKESIREGSHPYPEKFASCMEPEGCIAYYGKPVLLDDWFASDSPDGPDWGKLHHISASLSSVNAMAAFALRDIDRALVAVLRADMKTAINCMAAAGESLRISSFWDGWQRGVVAAEGHVKENQRKGGVTKNLPMAELRNWAIRQYENGTWPSPYNASFSIAPLAIAKAPEFGTRISIQRAQQTIYEWLLDDAKAKANKLRLPADA